MAGRAGGIEPLRLALRYAPPGIVVEYALTTRRSREKRLFHHEIDLQDALSGSASKALNIDAIVADLVAAHAHVLGGCMVSSRQLARLVRKLADVQDDHRVRTAAAGAAAASTPPLPQADYNRVSEAQLKQVKLKMDVVFQQNTVRPGEQGYVYDRQVAFHAPQEASDWDDE
ncbi:hypothetical protein PybrP1_007358 [[Pythium] brassicae (nom. inval.)]|nr:hypothetical protein PybrP1_007358 [[Pythium] brassicae (nom. inval.)]